MIDEARASERPEDETEDDYALRDRVVAAAVEASKSGERALLEEVLEPLHPADIADLLEQVEPEDRTAILKLAGDYIDGEILSEIDEDIRPLRRGPPGHHGRTRRALPRRSSMYRPAPRSRRASRSRTARAGRPARR